MNIQEKVREIAKLVEREAREDPPWQEGVVEKSRQELEALRGACLRLNAMSGAVGRMPPSPHTLRARAGGALIKFLQRALFWYTPPIVKFQNEAAYAIGGVCDLLEIQQQQLVAQRRQVQQLRGELLRVRKGGRPSPEISARGNGTVAHAPNSAEAGLLDSFLFASYSRLRGPEGETAKKLEVYLDLLRKLSLPLGPWLDLGCGRGEWLRIGCAAGYSAMGIDSNPAAVRSCREASLNAAEEDALLHLVARSNESLAVITAFHMVEHWPAEDLLPLVREAARTLKPGGVLIVETPDPANLLAVTHQFWRDPSHWRPVPMDLLELIFEYSGLKVIERLRLNPPPPSDRFPADGIEFADRLNQHFYGPQDYGLIGQR